jgi:hypothetical protein
VDPSSSTDRRDFLANLAAIWIKLAQHLGGCFEIVSLETLGELTVDL